MPAISIIVPVYNAADTLERCVASVLSQNFDDWELLLVDDGSVDDSLALCSRLCKKDSRIRLLTKKHSGVSSARNLALEHVSGKYVCFVDADDLIESDYLTSLYQHRAYDMVLCGYYTDQYSEQGEILRHQEFRPLNLDVSPIEDRTRLVPLFLKGMIHINCNKLLHADIIRNHHIRYPDIPVNEDFVFMLHYLEHCRSVKTIPTPLYHWTRTLGKKSSLSAFSFDQIKIINDAHLLTSRYFNDPTLAAQIMYYSYYWQILKYVEHLEKKEIGVHDLDTLMQNDLLKESFRLHAASSRGEKVMNYLLTHKFYRLFCLLNRKLSDGK